MAEFVYFKIRDKSNITKNLKALYPTDFDLIVIRPTFYHQHQDCLNNDTWYAETKSGKRGKFHT